MYSSDDKYFKTLILSWALLCWQRKCESDGKLRAELLTKTLELTSLVVDCAQWLTASFASYYLTVEMMLLVIHPVCFYACSTLVRAWGVLLSLLNVMTKLQNPNSQLSIPLLTKEVWVWWQAACRTLDKNSWTYNSCGAVCSMVGCEFRFELSDRWNDAVGN